MSIPTCKERLGPESTHEQTLCRVQPAQTHSAFTTLRTEKDETQTRKVGTETVGSRTEERRPQALGSDPTVERRIPSSVPLEKTYPSECRIFTVYTRNILPSLMGLEALCPL